MKAIKFILAIIIGLAALKMPYGYYSFMRTAAMIGFGYIAIKNFDQKKVVEGLICIGLAILFQPLFKVVMQKQMWIKIDISICILLLISVIFEFIKEAKIKSE